MQAAINADFFDFPGWSYVLVRARGAGEEWPPQAELLEQPSGYWQFGQNISGIQPSSLVSPPPGVTEVVGAYDPIIGFGAPVDQSGDPFMQELHRRSGIGLSWDSATIYLYASNAAIDGNGMANEMIALAAEAGAPAIAFATNQDGGGSSQLYVQGFGQVIDSGRQVIDHLGIYASGAGPAPNCPNRPPVGWLDGVACSGFAGWAQDPDEPKKSLDVHFYFDGPAGAPQARGPFVVHADVSRPDLCTALGSCTHAFTPLPPPAMLDGKPHEVHAYGIDSHGGTNAELAQSPRTMTCNPPAVHGAKRWISSPAVLATWHLGPLDVMPVPEVTLHGLRELEQLPDAPVLLRADDGSPEVWVADGRVKRHIVDPSVAAAWRFDLGAAVVRPAIEIERMPTGLPLPSRPLAIQARGPEIYLVDDVVESGVLDGGVTPIDEQGDASGCSCHVARSSDSGAPFSLVLVGLAAARFRKRRPSAQS